MFCQCGLRLARSAPAFPAVRYASSSARLKGKLPIKPKPPAPAQAKQAAVPLPKPAATAKPSSKAATSKVPTAKSQAAPSASPSVPASKGPVDRTVFEIKGGNTTNARLQYGVCFMLFCFCMVAAETSYRQPKQPSDPEAPRIPEVPAWKRYSITLAFVGTGFGALYTAAYFPARMVSRIVVHVPPRTTLPPGSKGGQIPYRESTVTIETAASKIFPRSFPPQTRPFTHLRLLGPLSSEPQKYHPKSTAFSRYRDQGKTVPSTVPLMVSNTRGTYTIRRRLGQWSDLPGFERALCENLIEQDKQLQEQEAQKKGTSNIAKKL